MVTSTPHAWNGVIIALDYIPHCYLGDLRWDISAVGYLSSSGGRSNVRVPICPRLHSKETTWASLGWAEGEREVSPTHRADGVRAADMVPEQQWTFVAGVWKEMRRRTDTNNPWPWLRGQVLFTWPVLGSHHDFGVGIPVLSELTRIGASSCHFQSREIRFSWTAAQQALEIHKWFVRAFSLGGHHERERI